jgi:hypothetical protein
MTALTTVNGVTVVWAAATATPATLPTAVVAAHLDPKEGD